MSGGPSLPDPCKCHRPTAYQDDDGLARCLNCGRLTAAPTHRPWTHSSTAH